MISLENKIVIPTTFPDKTSQVWKIEKELLDRIYKQNDATITWNWDFKNVCSEGELLQVAQLKMLLDTYVNVVHLKMPYLPYGRQDKRVDNESTFALKPFANLLNSLNFTTVEVLDAHNNCRAHFINNLTDRSPRNYIRQAYDESGADLLLFPDAGASARYNAYRIGFSVHAKKTRNQTTGDITGLEILGKVKGKKVLIVDDICDGGWTFTSVANAALKEGAKEVHLYVTHGIFSKGFQVLRDSGIKRIFTWTGEVANTLDPVPLKL